ncbi:hypothetical protein NL676_017467 [Syzygium grande]|nr:hypothetical protein NL676_017467 [Syzygium grande]
MGRPHDRPDSTRRPPATWSGGRGSHHLISVRDRRIDNAPPRTNARRTVRCTRAHRAISPPAPPRLSQARARIC